MSKVAEATQTPSSDGDFGNRLSFIKQNQSLFLLRLDGHFVRLYLVMSPFETLQLFSRQSRFTEQQTVPFCAKRTQVLATEVEYPAMSSLLSSSQQLRGGCASETGREHSALKGSMHGLPGNSGPRLCYQACFMPCLQAMHALDTLQQSNFSQFIC